MNHVFSDEQVLMIGGVLSVVITLLKLVVPYLQTKIGVGTKETVILNSLKEEIVSLKDYTKTKFNSLEGQLRYLAEISKMDEIKQEQHFKTIEKIEDKLERLERRS